MCLTAGALSSEGEGGCPTVNLGAESKLAPKGFEHSYGVEEKATEDWIPC
jgi:hypothetical protein